MIHMIHDLLPNPTDVYVTYDMTFVPDSAPAAAEHQAGAPLWLDVAGSRAYPVFDARRATGATAATRSPTRRARRAAARPRSGRRTSTSCRTT